MRRSLPLFGLVALVLIAGCAPQRRFRYTRVATVQKPDRPGVTFDEAFDAATAVLAEQFGPLQNRDRRGGYIECKPVAYVPSQLEYTERRMPLSAAQARRRRVASIQLEAKEGVLTAGIRVEIQREDTHETRQFARLRDPYDTFVETPVDEEPAGGAAAQTIWTFVRFDDRAEREALADLAARLKEMESLPPPPGAEPKESTLRFPPPPGSPPSPTSSPPN